MNPAQAKAAWLSDRGGLAGTCRVAGRDDGPSAHLEQSQALQWALVLFLIRRMPLGLVAALTRVVVFVMTPALLMASPVC